MPILETVYTVDNYQLAIISLGKPERGWWWFGMWEIQDIFRENLREGITTGRLGLAEVYREPSNRTYWMARPSPALGLMRWWFRSGRWWWYPPTAWLFSNGYIWKPDGTYWRWSDLRTLSLRPKVRQERRQRWT